MNPHIRQFLRGCKRVGFFLVAAATFPAWLPFVIIYAIGSNTPTKDDYGW